MKVVVNKKVGGFRLSDLALEKMLEVGFTLNDKDDGTEADIWKDPDDGSLYLMSWDEKKLRCDPRLIKIVEELGEAANSWSSRLEIVEIPFETTEGWHIVDNEGRESIHEDHRVW